MLAQGDADSRSGEQAATADSADSATLVSDTASAAPSEAEIQAQLDAIKADANLPEASQAALSKQFEQALSDLKQAQANRAKLEEFTQLAQTAPQQQADLQSELEALQKQAASAQTSGSDSDPAASAALLAGKELDFHVRLQEASLQQISTQLEEVSQQLVQLKRRPEQIGLRLPEASQELKDTESALQLALQGTADANKANFSQKAELWGLQAKQALLESELALRSEEQSSLGVRESLLRVKESLLSLQQEQAQQALDILQAELQERRLDEAQALSAEVENLQQELGAQALPQAQQGAAQELLGELQGYAYELASQTQQLKNLQGQKQAMSERLEQAQARFTRVQEQLALGGLESTFGQALLSEYRALGNPRELDLAIKERQQELRNLRLQQLEMEDLLSQQEDWQERFAELSSNQTQREFTDRLLASRGELLAELESTQVVRIDQAQQLNVQSRELHSLILEFREFLHEKLFWTRSSPALSGSDLQRLPVSLSWLFSAKHGTQLKEFALKLPRERPLACLFAALSVIALLLLRGKLKALLKASSESIRRVRQDHYRFTLQALGASLLLALPVPLLTAFFGWALQWNFAGVAWMQGLGVGLLWTTWFLGFAVFLHHACQKQGLAIAHFGWSEEFAGRLRRLLLPLLIPFQALLLVSYACLYALETEHLSSLGRLSFLIAQLFLAYGLWRILRPALRIKKSAKEGREEGDSAGKNKAAEFGFWRRKKRMILQALLLLLPLANIALVIAGFTIGAMALNTVLIGSLCFIGLGVVAYSLLLRWFLVKQRKLALQELLEERKERREAALAQVSREEGGHHGEEMSVEVEESELDLEETVSQTKRLLRSLSIITVILLLWWYWERSLPIQEFLREQSLFGWISLLGLAQASLVVAVSLTVIRNLPGLLDLAGFRDSGLDLGTRYAIVTICQYALGAIALTVLSQILGLDWAKFGWVAAALSLGLGFGLQEVVANFVCGIILLFERPIRIGDVVTLNGVTGTVSRIKMRATTITNWDRQDFVVPNKDLITGSLVNWTLLNPINRLTIQVGVAYGSDTALAMKLLREVAQEHPLIMDDPGPLISFDSFGDSTLDLTLRCYLPNMDNRLKTTTELHSEINRKFAEAGIEIAFPQQDIYIKGFEGRLS